MDGTQSPFRLRAYANLCRDFIDSATPMITDVMTRDSEVINWNAEAQNMLFTFRAAAFFSQDSTLDILMLITPFTLPKVLLAYRQDKIATKFADNIAKRLMFADAFSPDHVRRKLPAEMRTATALQYTEQRKLKGLGTLIERTLS